MVSTFVLHIPFILRHFILLARLPSTIFINIVTSIFAVEPCLLYLATFLIILLQPLRDRPRREIHALTPLEISYSRFLFFYSLSTPRNLAKVFPRHAQALSPER